MTLLLNNSRQEVLQFTFILRNVNIENNFIYSTYIYFTFVLRVDGREDFVTSEIHFSGGVRDWCNAFLWEKVKMSMAVDLMMMSTIAWRTLVRGVSGAWLTHVACATRTRSARILAVQPNYKNLNVNYTAFVSVSEARRVNGDGKQ